MAFIVDVDILRALPGLEFGAFLGDRRSGGGGAGGGWYVHNHAVALRTGVCGRQRPVEPAVCTTGQTCRGLVKLRVGSSAHSRIPLEDSYVTSRQDTVYKRWLAWHRAGD